LYHGHSFTLYLYDEGIECFSEVTRKDANSIINRNQIFKIANSYASFADVFRYQMVRETGLIWTDLDYLCLKPDWKFGPYVFGESSGGEAINNGIFSAPQNSLLLHQLIKVSSHYDRSKIVWGEIGPILLTEMVKKLNLNHYVQNMNVFHPLNYWEYFEMFDANKKDSVLARTEKSHAISLYNHMISLGEIDKNIFPDGSALLHFEDQFFSK
jgi:mannosyltransferase OCH1-like enzyme